MEHTKGKAQVTAGGGMEELQKVKIGVHELVNDCLEGYNEVNDLTNIASFSSTIL